LVEWSLCGPLSESYPMTPSANQYIFLPFDTTWRIFRYILHELKIKMLVLSYRFYSHTWCTKFRNGRIFSLSMLPLSPVFRIEEMILRFY
jgi:hypothetical protein